MHFIHSEHFIPDSTVDRTPQRKRTGTWQEASTHHHPPVFSRPLNQTRSNYYLHLEIVSIPFDFCSPMTKSSSFPMKLSKCLYCTPLLFLYFSRSTLILEQSRSLLEALSPERLLSLSSCCLIPETLLLCFPTSQHQACLFPELLICFKW